MNLADGAPIVVGQTADAMGDVQLVLSHNSGAALAQQFVVVQQRTGYRILDSCHAYHRRVFMDALEHLLKRGAALQLYLFTLEVEVGRNVVERTRQSLYSYSFHLYLILILFFNLKKFPLSLVCEAGPYLFSSILQRYTALRFTGCCKVKIKAVKVCILNCHIARNFLHFGCKSNTFL